MNRHAAPPMISKNMLPGSGTAATVRVTFVAPVIQQPLFAARQIRQIERAECAGDRVGREQIEDRAGGRHVAGIERDGQRAAELGVAGDVQLIVAGREKSYRQRANRSLRIVAMHGDRAGELPGLTSPALVTLPVKSPWPVIAPPKRLKLAACIEPPSR